MKKTSFFDFAATLYWLAIIHMAMLSIKSNAMYKTVAEWMITMEGAVSCEH